MIGLALIVILACPFVLSAGVAPNLSRRIRQVLVAICGALAIVALGLRGLGMNTLPLALLALVPAYQLELCRYVMKRFQRTHGREMQLIAFRIETGERMHDALYSKGYFAAAVGIPLLMFVLLVS